jgi:hypothetical protein
MKKVKLIKILDDVDAKSLDLTIGNIYDVTVVDEGYVNILDDKEEWNELYDGEYEVVE